MRDDTGPTPPWLRRLAAAARQVRRRLEQLRAFGATLHPLGLPARPPHRTGGGDRPRPAA